MPISGSVAFGTFVLALLSIFLLLVIPGQIQHITPAAFGYFPVEFLILGFLLLLPRFWGFLSRVAVTLVLVTGFLLKIADAAANKIFARDFNLIFDAHLLIDGVVLLKGALGSIAVVFALLFLAILIAVIIYSIYWLLGRIQSVLTLTPKLSSAVLSGLLLVWIGLLIAGWPRANAPFYSHLVTHVSRVESSITDLHQFRELISKPSAAHDHRAGLFEKLKGKDFLIIFVESYGRTVLDNPEYAAHIRPLLEEKSKILADHGFGMRSSYLKSPTVGGMSWLAHATAMSGLWIDSQVRYDSLVMSDYPSVNRLFRSAGWRTVAVMPAITMVWPEGNYFGYDHIYNAHNSGYRGKPFNWITMPDQYTLSAFQQFERKTNSRSAVMAEIALISSHAPWTPVPKMVDWNSVGDGRIFDAQATAGDTPEVVWRDQARVRTQYRLSIEYALENLVSYILNYGDENLVVMVFGDHQPAPIVTGNTTNRDVPVHFIARDPAVIAAINNWKWTPGLVPAEDTTPWLMSEIAKNLMATFSVAPEQKNTEK